MLKPGTKVEVEKDVGERDKYGRFLAYIYVNGKMINESLLEKGLARVAYIYAPNTRYVDRFEEIQDKAKKEKVGIWTIDGYAESGFMNETGKPNSSTSQSKAATNSSSSSSSVSSNTNTNSNSGTTAASSSTNQTQTNTTKQPFQNDPSDDVEKNTSCKGKIKGNASSKIYHEPGDQYYDRTADNIVWFCTAQDAENAGYRASLK